MAPPSRDRDFSDPEVPTDADPSPLRRVILAQSVAPGGAAVALFGPATVGGGAPEASAAQEVSWLAADLGLPLRPPDLFTPDAYVLQSALGERLLTQPAQRRGIVDGDSIGGGEGGVTARLGPADTERFDDTERSDPERSDDTEGSDPGRPNATDRDSRTDTGGNPWTAGHSAAILRSPLIALNYHDIQPADRGEVESMVRRVAALGRSLDPGGSDAAPGPQVMVGFYDGYASGRFGADLCAGLGIRAVFFPLFEPTDEPGCSELTDDDLADIAQAHEIGFHTSSHVTPDEVTPDSLEREVLGPLRRIESVLGRPPSLAAWRGGARFDPRRVGDAALVRAGVRGMVSNWSVERIGEPGQTSTLCRGGSR